MLTEEYSMNQNSICYICNLERAFYTDMEVCKICKNSCAKNHLEKDLINRDDYVDKCIENGLCKKCRIKKNAARRKIEVTGL